MIEERDGATDAVSATYVYSDAVDDIVETHRATNGNGVDEVIIGAPFLGRGEVYVFQVSEPVTAADGLWFLCQ